MGKKIAATATAPIYGRVREILEAARRPSRFVQATLNAARPGVDVVKLHLGANALVVGLANFGKEFGRFNRIRALHGVGHDHHSIVDVGCIELDSRRP